MGNVYLFSKIVDGKRVNLTVEELSEIVKKLVTHALKLPHTDDDDDPVLVGMHIKKCALKQTVVLIDSKALLYPRYQAWLK